jgi:hypothetical protein
MSTPERYSWRPSEIKVYLLHVVALFRPSTDVPAFEVHQGQVGDISGWSRDDHEMLIAEGRRQLDRQIADLERIRSRCQFLFTTVLGLLVLVFGTVRTIGGPESHRVLLALLFWCVSIICLVLGLLGTAALITARKDVQIIDTARLSQTAPPVFKALAPAYANAVHTGENSVATSVTVQRDAVLLMVAGALAYASAWLLAVI